MTLLKDKSKRQDLRADLYAQLNSDGVAIPTAIKMLRKILGKDQSKFSAEIGIAVSTLRKIEQDNGNVTLATIQQILDKYSLELVVRAKKL